MKTYTRIYLVASILEHLGKSFNGLVAISRVLWEGLSVLSEVDSSVPSSENDDLVGSDSAGTATFLLKVSSVGVFVEHNDLEFGLVDPKTSLP
mgnify:FL=1